jgi:hypothetical protein
MIDSEKLDILQQAIYLGKQTTNAIAGDERRCANAFIAVADIALITCPMTGIFGIASVVCVLGESTLSCVRRGIDLHVVHEGKVRYR